MQPTAPWSHSTAAARSTPTARRFLPVVRGEHTRTSQATNANITDPSAAVLTFFPDAAGDYLIGLTVSDGNTWSDVETLTVTAAERGYNTSRHRGRYSRSHRRRRAECTESGYTTAVTECAVRLSPLGDDATATDADGRPPDNPVGSAVGRCRNRRPDHPQHHVTLSEAEPTEPGSCEDYVYEFQLTVTDCYGDTVTDIVTYTSTCCGVEGAAHPTGSG